MMLVLGGRGYIGEALLKELDRRGWDHKNLSRAEIDYTDFSVLYGLLRELRPEFLVNAAGFTGKPNVDACEIARAETLLGNAILPRTISDACQAAGVPWGHVSSGCVFTGAKVRRGDQTTVETDLTHPELADLAIGSPEAFEGFRETDEPNFSFRRPPCSFYSGSKALGDEVLAADPSVYVWRLRIPFDEWNHPRNYLTKLMTYPKVYQNVNSISHRGEFARACFDLWERRAPTGVYHMTNPGFVTTRQVVEAIGRVLKPDREYEYWKNDDEFYRQAARTPRSNCILDVSKLLATGVPMRPVDEAIETSLRDWRA